MDKQIEALISLLRLSSKEDDFQALNGERRNQIATAVDDLIMLYKWPFRNQDRFEAMKSVARRMRQQGIPVMMQSVSFDRLNVTEPEEQWIQTIEDR